AQSGDIAGVDGPDRLAKRLIANDRPIKQLDDVLAVGCSALARVIERSAAASVGLPAERAVPDEQLDQRQRTAPCGLMQWQRVVLAVPARRGTGFKQQLGHGDAPGGRRLAGTDAP